MTTIKAEKHVSYMRTYPSGEERPVYCGEWDQGGTELCDQCLKGYEEYYPQGWRYYPGDVCRHGRYTGGCGPDLMCGPCEMGEE